MQKYPTKPAISDREDSEIHRPALRGTGWSSESKPHEYGFFYPLLMERRASRRGAEGRTGAGGRAISEAC